jgi:predicted enzyme related to lactoylglutathione lyase
VELVHQLMREWTGEPLKITHERPKNGINKGDFCYRPGRIEGDMPRPFADSIQSRCVLNATESIAKHQAIRFPKKMSAPPITRIALYVRDINRLVAFYQEHFDFQPQVAAPDKMILHPASGGCALVLLEASRGHRVGQSCVKIIFDVPDVKAFREARLKAGSKFGKVHRGPGYEFSNARDPAKNLIQISNAYLQDRLRFS